MNAMFHRHLVAAYAVTWIIQVSYLAYTAWKWVTARKAQRSAEQLQHRSKETNFGRTCDAKF